MSGLTKGAKYFGHSNVKTREELRAVGGFDKRKSSHNRGGDWDLDAQDALFVPILSNSRDRHISNLKGFVSSKEKYCVPAQNPYGIESAPNYRAPEETKCSSESARIQQDIAQIRTRVGIYSTSANYCERVEKALSNLVHYECNYFGLSDALGPMKLEQALSIDVWVVNLLDDDETNALDEIMDICAEKTTLFLVEPEPTPQCITKLQEFLLAA